MLHNDEGQLKQREVDWKWERTKTGEKLTLTHLPTGKQVSEELRSGGSRYGGKAVVQDKKRDLYDTLFDKLEIVIYGPQQPRRS